MALCQVIPFISISTGSFLVSPVGRQPMLCYEVHLSRANLHFHGDAVIPNDHCVQGTVTIGLWVFDVVLAAAVYGLPQVVYLRDHSTCNETAILPLPVLAVLHADIATLPNCACY